MARNLSVRSRSLYLVRHAIAAERGAEWPDDAERPLTPLGRHKMRRITKGLRQLEIRVDLVLTSPYVRATETAEILAAGLSPRPDVETLPVLAPGAAPERLVAALAPFKTHDAIALVGHEPDLGALAAWLIGARTPLPFKKGGACRIDLVEWPPHGSGQLIWFATPRLLRAD